MNKQPKQLYSVKWSQKYQNWNMYQPVRLPLQQSESESELDLTLARAVLARIMAL